MKALRERSLIKAFEPLLHHIYPIKTLMNNLSVRSLGIGIMLLAVISKLQTISIRVLVVLCMVIAKKR